RLGAQAFDAIVEAGSFQPCRYLRVTRQSASESSSRSGAVSVASSAAEIAICTDGASQSEAKRPTSAPNNNPSAHRDQRVEADVAGSQTRNIRTKTVALVSRSRPKPPRKMRTPTAPSITRH